MTYFPLGLLASASSEIMYIQLHRRKTIKRKILAKQKDSFKIKFDKMLKFICIHHLFPVLQLIYLVLLKF